MTAPTTPDATSDVVVVEEDDQPVVTPEPSPDEPSRMVAAGKVLLRWVLALGAALLIFAAFLIAKGTNPADVYQTMWQSIAGDTNSFGELLVQSAPFLLAGLAVAVPARAGLFNIGGEGQLLLGGIGAVWMSQLLANQYTPMMQLTLMALSGALFGAMWAAIPALLKLWTFTSEAITSLLLNYVAALLLAYLVHGSWKDPKSFGFPATAPLELDERWPIIWGNRVHAGIVVSVVMAVVVWAIIRYTPWGFRVRVVGGNPEAARRAGFRVGAITVGAMVFGGALAGLAGMIEVTGVEGQARPGMMAGYGFIGFLASWLVKHDPLKIIGSALLLGAIAVGGNGLKLSAGLSGAAVYVLMSLILLAVLGWGQVRKKATT